MNNTLLRLLTLFFLGLSLPVLSQRTDLARVEYTYFPKTDSGNTFNRLRTSFNFPIALNGEERFLVPYIEYRNIGLEYADPTRFSTGEIDRFQSFNLSLGYTSKINEDWRFGAEGGVIIASNFGLGEIYADDLIYTGSFYFIKIKEEEELIEPWKLILGLEYSTTAGIPFPLPVINYYRRFDPKWSFSAGTPRSNLTYYFDDRNSLQAFVGLDGFYGNIQQRVNTDPVNERNVQMAEKISMTTVLAGLGYELNFTENISFYIYGGHTLINNIRLRDGNLDRVYTINDINSFYGRTGLKLTIL